MTPAIFLSHAWVDQSPVRVQQNPLRGLVRLLLESLSKADVTVFFDERRIEELDDIQARIRDGLGQCGLMVCWYSDAYRGRRACDWELTTAIAADPRRVIVVNPERTIDHIQPASLMNNLVAQARAADDLEGWDLLARRIVQRAESMVGTFGTIALAESTRRYGDPPTRFTRFVGRSESLYDLDSLLRPATAASGGDRVPTAVVVNGLGGVGKSALANEYATRFAAAYQGGVYWLRMGSPVGEADPSHQVTAQVSAALIRIADQLRTNGTAPNPDATAHSDDVVRRDIARHLDHLDERPFLWVVDDVPPGLSSAEFASCLPPGGRGHTLITSQGASYRHVPNYTLPVMSIDESIELLLGAEPRDENAEVEAARQLVARLGHLPLALEVVGAMARLPGTSPADLLAEMDAAEEDAAIDLVEEAASNPFTSLSVTEHPASPIATFGLSIRRLDPPALWLLAVASALNVGPLPVRLLWLIARELTSDLPTSPRAALGLLLSRSLARTVDTETIEVHGLVGGATLKYLADPSFVAACGRAAQRPILDELGDVEDIGTHARSQRIAAFARALTTHFITRLPDVIDVNLCRLLGRFLHVEHRYAESVELERFAFERLRVSLGPDSRQALVAQVNLAISVKYSGDIDQAVELQSAAWEALHREFGPDDIDTLSAQHNLANLLAATDRPRFRALALDAYRSRLRVLGPDDPHTLFSLHSLLARSVVPEPYEDVVAAYQDLIERRTRILGPDHTTTLTSVSNYIQRLTHLGRAAEALPMARHLVSRRSTLYGPDHSTTMSARVRLIAVLATLPDRSPAEVKAVAAQIVQFAMAAGEQSDVIDLSNAGNVFRQIGETDSAVLVLRAASRLARHDPCTPPQTRLLVEHNLAAAIAATGELSLGRDEYDRLISEMTRTLGSDHRLTLRGRRQRAIIANKLNDPTSFVELLELADTWRALCGERSPEFAEALSDLAEASERGGRPDDAALYREQMLATGRADDIEEAGHV